MTKRVADLVVDTLQAAGVSRCYGSSGTTLNRIAHASIASDIDWVHVRHEEAAPSPRRRGATDRPPHGLRGKLVDPAVFTSSTASMRPIATARLSS